MKCTSTPPAHWAWTAKRVQEIASVYSNTAERTRKKAAISRNVVTKTTVNEQSLLNNLLIKLHIQY